MKNTILSSFSLSLCLSFFLIGCGENKKENKVENTPATLTEQQAKTPNNWAERLGWPAGKKVIMLHADDIGMCPEANIAAEKQLMSGQIQSAAVMIPC